jgi:hypothetical protein
VFGGILCAVGIALLVVPLDVAPWWPWPLATLAGRMAGATLIGVGLLAISVAWIDDRVTGRVAAIGLVVAGVAAALVVIFAAPLSEPSVWVYLVVCAVAAGLGLLAGRRGVPA